MRTIEWHDLTELLEGYSTEIAEIKYLIGVGEIPDNLIKYSDGQILVSAELADCLSASINISMDTDRSISCVLCPMMEIERRRKETETREIMN